MTDRDVIDVLRDMCNTIDYAIASRVSPAYPDTSIRTVLGRAADEVERLRDDLRIAESVNHQCESVDAAIARVVALAENPPLLRAAYFTTPAGSRLNCSDSEAWGRVADEILRSLDGGEQ